MKKNGLKQILFLIFVLPVLLALVFQALPASGVARAQSNCDPKLNPCTDTPTYPPKVTDTNPPQPTATATYPPKVTDTPTYIPKQTATPTYPPKISDTPANPPKITKTATYRPKPSVISTITQTTTPFLVFPSPTFTPLIPGFSATPKPTVLGVTGTPVPTYIPLIPYTAPTATLQPLQPVLLRIGDIWVTGIEFTQATQIYGTGGPLDNSIPLVAGKKTVVRVYVQSDNYSAQWNDVTARLTVTGGREPGRILLPVTENSRGTITVKPTGSDRTRYYESFNFLLDQDETSAGARHFSVEIFSLSGRPELNTANNHMERDARFSPVPDISTMAVVYGNDGTDPTVPRLDAAPWTDFFRHVVVAENMAPVANFGLYYFPGLGRSPLMVPNLDAARAWADRLLARPEYWSSRIYLLQPEHDCNCGYASGNRMNGQNNLRSPGAILSQEVAHSYGMWWHAVSPEHPADLANPDFPYAHGSIGVQVGAKTYNGGSPLFFPIPPTYGGGIHVHDFMSYGSSPIWVSPFTYCTYMSTLTNGGLTCPSGAERASLPKPQIASASYHNAELAEGTYLYVAGTLFPDDTAAFDPFEQIKSATDISRIPAGDEYHLQFLDSSGNNLKDIPFTPEETHHDETNPKILFNLTVPYPLGTTRILLAKNGQTLAERVVSPNAPTVDFKFFGLDQILSGTHNFSWSVSDADGDPLIYSIEYSRDGGQTWLALDVGMTTPSAEINFDNLPGTDNGMLRVTASDGVNTTEARSTDTFSVERKKPIITSVSEDEATYAGQPTYVEITVFDWEDGVITDPAAITWVSDLDGKLTSGRWIAPDTLSVGDHTLTATVSDSDGNTTSASVHIKVLASENTNFTQPQSIYKFGTLCGLPVLLVVMIVSGIFILRRRKKTG